MGDSQDGPGEKGKRRASVYGRECLLSLTSFRQVWEGFLVPECSWSLGGRVSFSASEAQC